MSEPITKRTPLVIAAEINKIKQQSCRIMLTNAIEIGRRLKEAKALLPYGEWKMAGRIGELFPAQSQQADVVLRRIWR